MSGFFIIFQKKMRALLTAFIFSFAGTTSMAQVQFWNQNDLEDQGMATIRKAGKVSRMIVYQTGETGNVSDSSTMESVSIYNRNGQLVSRTRYKYNWNKKVNELLSVDSFAYDGRGQWMWYAAYEGPYNRQTFESVAAFNRKGQVERMSHYNFFDGEKKLETYEVLTWNAKNQPVKLVSSKADKKKNFERTFTYDASGNLVSHSFKDLGLNDVYMSGWKNGQLAAYSQKSGKTTVKQVAYTADAAGRRIKKETKTNTDYYDITEYRYNGDSKLPVFTYLKYPGYNGKNDTRHEYRVFVYRYF